MPRETSAHTRVAVFPVEVMIKWHMDVCALHRQHVPSQSPERVKPEGKLCDYDYDLPIGGELIQKHRFSFIIQVATPHS